MDKKEFLKSVKIDTNLTNMSKEDIEELVILAVQEYRSGSPIIEDCIYDHVLLPALQSLYPESKLLTEVEVEPEGLYGATVDLPERMLSTNKVYTSEALQRWINTVLAAASQLQIDKESITVRITPKLDGFAVYDDGQKLYTRGDGRRGSDITRILDHKVPIYGNLRGFKNSELVIDKKYFLEYLSNFYDNTRNVISAVIKEGEIDPLIKEAIEAKAIMIVPFRHMPGTRCKIDELQGLLELSWNVCIASTPYHTDGIVIEVMDQRIINLMGSTNHHHKWQISYKKNSQFELIKVQDVIYQTGKSGIITPVALLTPTLISGVTISRVTCHNVGTVIEKGIGKDAIIRVCRSGLVIPKIEEVVSRSTYHINIPKQCPTCGHETELKRDFLYCTNKVNCAAQIVGTITYFFKTIGNCRGFGPANVELLVNEKFDTLSKIYQMEQKDFDQVIGGLTGVNLYNSLQVSKNVPLDDWRFLAAFAINEIGRGGCELLLKNHSLETIFDLTVTEVMAIKGFAEVTATQLINELKRVESEFKFLLPLFKIRKTVIQDQAENLPLSGKTFVFTGTLESGTREALSNKAKALGATTASSVSSKTSYLVCGSNVGANKIETAKTFSIPLLSEQDFLSMIGECKKK